MTDHNRNKALVILEALGLCLLALLVFLVWVLLWAFRLMGDGARFFLSHLNTLVFLLRDRFVLLRDQISDGDDVDDDEEDPETEETEEDDDGEEERDGRAEEDGDDEEEEEEGLTLDAQEAKEDEGPEGPRSGLLYDWLCEQVSGVSARAETVDAEPGEEVKPE